MFSLPFAEFVDHEPGIDLVPLDAARPVAEMGGPSVDPCTVGQSSAARVPSIWCPALSFAQE